MIASSRVDIGVAVDVHIAMHEGLLAASRKALTCSPATPGVATRWVNCPGFPIESIPEA